ncbi:MAG TPA: 3-oxoacyl-ACP synthase [Daejeonella sp.]|nr:3-oxoacyl-ACP synthase [Daejeonella sp.]
MASIKETLYQLCTDYILERIDAAEKAILAAQESAGDDTKSSAGDKYETGREMMQQEINRNRQQLQEAQKLLQVLRNISPDQTHTKIQIGSLAMSNMGNFYLAISAGQFKVADQNYFAISMASPIGRHLAGKSAGEEFQFNGKLFRILEVQ